MFADFKYLRLMNRIDAAVSKKTNYSGIFMEGHSTPKSKLNNPQKTLSRLRLVAALEGISFLFLLLIAMPLKYFFQDARLIRPVGMLHGWLFVLYVLLLLQAHLQLRWKRNTTALCFLLSLLPFGTFYADKRYFRPALKPLEGNNKTI